MTAKRRVPLGKKVRQEEMQANLDRAERRASKRGRAADRAAYNEQLAAGIDRQGLSDAMTRLLIARDEAAAAPRRRGGPRTEPAGPEGRWVPIGPSVVRRGQAVDRPRVSGRIRDIQVDVTGRRAYAGTASGGVWYTDDGGSTWSPVGGWAVRSRTVGGPVNAQAVGSLLVAFGATSAQDVILAGTGELPFAGAPPDVPATAGILGGTGILAAVNPPDPTLADPWEPDAGLARLEGLATVRMVRRPGSVAGKSGPPAMADRDVVVACTSGGAFVGTRQPLPAAPPLVARDGYVWVPMPAMVAAHPNATVCDAVWLPTGRLVMAVVGTGLVYTDDMGVNLANILSTQVPAVMITGVMSLARGSGNRVVLLGETGGTPTLWVIPDATLATPVATAVSTALPAGLWPGQRDYDQALAVDPGVGVGGADRVYVGGSVVMPRPGTDWGASLYCFDVVPPAPFTLAPALGISTTAPPAPPPPLPPGAGADQAGLIGNNVHGDVHCIRLTGAAPPAREVWVGSDGGVFVSSRAGRVHTFAALNTGLATLQTVFVRSHPVSGHMVAAGMQDNGTQVRTGDTVWDELYEADGGGLAFHPLATHMLVRQYIQADWSCTAVGAFVDPMNRNPGWSLGGAAVGGESFSSAFYSGVATVRIPPVGPPVRGRIALGTNRVWITDDLGVGLGPNTWQTLPFPNGAVQDGRAGPPAGTPTAPQLGFGVPAPALGVIITMAWASTTELLVVYWQGIVRYTETAPGTWTTKTWRLNDRRVAMPRTTVLTDVCPIPGARNFYVTTTGVVGSPEETVWFYSPSDDQFHRTALRHRLDTPPPPAVPVTVGPRDPAYSVVLDPVDPTIVFVGTATGVWRGHRTTNLGVHTWDPYIDGLPEAAVQDLHVWVDPAAVTPYTAATPRVLRAGVQSRGVWEVDLAADAKRTTWIRANAFDNRRLPLAPTFDSLANPVAPPAPMTASPDIVVRPKWPRSAAPSFIGGPLMTAGLANAYQLWTFQTAFRWLYPSVIADGQWTDALGNLVALHRTSLTAPLPALPQIDAAVWNDVVGRVGVGGVRVGGVRVRANGTTTRDPADDFAVYRAPWHTARSPAAAPTEIDFMESVVPPRPVGPIWEVYRETSTVDVLVHHRDSRRAPIGTTFVILMWRSGATPAALMALSPVDVITYCSSGGVGAVPPGWNVVPSGVGAVMQGLTVPIDARMPRGVSIDVDLSAPTVGPNVLFVAFVGSIMDDSPPLQPSMSTTANVPPTSITEMVTCWPYAAARVVSIVNRPV